MNRTWTILLLVVIAIIFLVGVALAVFYKTFLSENVQRHDVTVIVPPEATFEQVMDTLRKYEVLNSEETFRKTAKALKYKTMRVGRYDISDCRSNLDLVRLLRRHSQTCQRPAQHRASTLDCQGSRF